MENWYAKVVKRQVVIANLTAHEKLARASKPPILSFVNTGFLLAIFLVIACVLRFGLGALAANQTLESVKVDMSPISVLVVAGNVWRSCTK